MRRLMLILFACGIASTLLRAGDIACVDRNGWRDCQEVRSCWEKVREVRPIEAIWDWWDGYCRWTP